jgi:hypothetical protein
VSAGQVVSAEVFGTRARGRCDVDERERDMVVLRWIARFGFTTAPLLAQRFGVTRQRMSARLRRLAAEGAVARTRRAANRPSTVALSAAGGERVGIAVRGRAPRPAVLGHELAIGKRVLAIEAHFARLGENAMVLTEAEMRWGQAAGQGLYSARVRDGAGRWRRRWPDYVVQTAAGRTAVELEFSAKSSARLESIVEAYLTNGLYDCVDFVLLEGPRHEALWRRLGAIVEAKRAMHDGLRPFDELPRTQLRLVAWRDPLPSLHAGIYPFPRLEGGA